MSEVPFVLLRFAQVNQSGGRPSVCGRAFRIFIEHTGPGGTAPSSTESEARLAKHGTPSVMWDVRRGHFSTDGLLQDPRAIRTNPHVKTKSMVFRPLMYLDSH